MRSGGIGETARLVAQLDLQDNFSKGIGSALGGLGRLEGGLGRMSRGAGQVASGLDRLGTRAALAAAGGLAAVVTTAASFEQAFTGVEKTVDATEGQLAELEASFREMARTIPVSFEELSAIGEAGGALGIATEDLEDFTDVVARLSVSTNLSADAAATALGQLGNVLHLSGGEFREFADSLVALGNDGASTESQIVEMAARFGAAGNSAGLTKEEILALGSAVASMGIQVEAGGSALSRIFNNVATNIGTSSEKAVAFADTLGLSARQFRDAWERDALGTFQDFLRELGKLDQFEQASVLKSVGLTNTRDVNTVRLMAQNVGFVADQLEVAATAQGDLNTESQKFFDTATGQWKVLVNNLRDAGATIGTELLPIFKELTAEFTAFLDKPGTRDALRSFGQDLAKGIRSVVSELKGADFSGLIDGMKLAATVAKGAFDAFRSLPPQVQSLAIAALVANKVSGGAVGQIARGLGNIVAGGLQTVLGRSGGKIGGILAGPGSSPLNPLFVSVVGPGGIGGPGGVAGGPGGGLWRTIGGIFGLAAAAVIAAEVGSEMGRQTRTAKDAFNASGGGFLGLEGLLGGGSRSPQSSTPLGQFSPRNAGGTPVPVAIVSGGGTDNAITSGIRVLDRNVRRALKEGDIHEARIAAEQAANLRRLGGIVDRGTNTIIPHLGRTNRALAVANRALNDGNARQREVAARIREARDATARGFQASNAQLGVIAAKPDPVVNVTVPVSTTVSINDIIRSATTYNAALSIGSQTRSGFKP